MPVGAAVGGDGLPPPPPSNVVHWDVVTVLLEPDFKTTGPALAPEFYSAWFTGPPRGSQPLCAVLPARRAVEDGCT